MKKLNILLLSAIAMGSTFVSCTKDDKPSNLSMSGKWTFSQLTVTDPAGNVQTKNSTFGWAAEPTQCADTPDYIKFTGATGAEYGNNDNNNTADCTLTTFPFTYSTTSSTLTVKDLLGQGQDGNFNVIKNTSSELVIEMTVDNVKYKYTLVKA